MLRSSSTSRSKVANHSARKTCISSLLNNNINPIHVSQLSGHKNTDSLKSYHSASKVHQKQMSDIVNCSNSSSTIPSTSKQAKRPLQEITNHQNSFSVDNSRELVSSTFCGANMHDCVFNININQNFPAQIPKRRRIIYDSDEE